MAARDRRLPRATGVVATSLLAGGLAAVAAPFLRTWLGALRGGTTAPEKDRTAALGRGRPEEPPTPAALAQGFETRDAQTRTIVLVIGTAVAVIVLCIAGLFAFSAALHRRAAEAPPPTAEQQAVLLPPGPPLQSDPLVDIDVFRTAELNKLQGYGWRDRTAGRARIPLARAMAIVVGRPLDPPPP